ncbi:CAP domain-containing protein [Aliiroseovarius subalbicans]|uniref:CAP domain-containing protein n=1 Tax=Aliiroseovarius subalbicans TaxID=2925840 RepID=UPI001F57A79A|nr:CAP domain-containing protein [Aliiroseovarius subalbicans]MCI2400245.1 CAP domain-containing protein [Aliiroseovarius subalbicans]
MNRHLKLLAALAFGAMTLTATSASAGCSRVQISGSEVMVPRGRINQKLLDAAILAEVNYERCRHGLKALIAEPRLRSTAKGHSDWMARTSTVSHRSSTTPTQRLKRSGVKFRNGGENISMLHYYQIDNQMFIIRDAASCNFKRPSGAAVTPHSYHSLARSAVAYWMASKGHRANILNRKVRMMGSAGALDKSAQHCGTVYLTQNFAG